MPNAKPVYNWEGLCASKYNLAVNIIPAIKKRIAISGTALYFKTNDIIIKEPINPPIPTACALILKRILISAVNKTDNPPPKMSTFMLGQIFKSKKR